MRSEVFPGLWLDVAALVPLNVQAVMALLQQGLASPEHAAFVALLQRRFQPTVIAAPSHPFVMVSSRLSSTLATTVHAAKLGHFHARERRPLLASARAAASFLRYCSRLARAQAAAAVPARRASAAGRRTGGSVDQPVAIAFFTSVTIRRARAAEHSTKTRSLSVARACKGVLVRGPAVAGDLPAGGVEGDERRVGGGPPPEGVQAAAVLVAGRAHRPAVAAVGVGPDAVRLVGKDARPAQPAHQQTADRQGVVTHHLGVEPETRSPGEEPIVGITVDQLRR